MGPRIYKTPPYDKFIAVTLLICLCAAVQTTKAQDPSVPMEGVIDLDPSNVDDVLNGRKISLVEFYAPWCGHCKRLAPEYGKLGDMIKDDPSMSNFVTVAKLDCDKHRELGSKFGIQGYPTLKVFTRGISIAEKDEAFPYEQARTAEAMFEYLSKLVQTDKMIGRHEELDALATEFLAATVKDEILQKAKARAEKLLEGPVYVKVMEKAIKKGEGYFKKEKERLAKIMSTGQISKLKFAEMILKSNVLDAFLTS